MRSLSSGRYSGQRLLAGLFLLLTFLLPDASAQTGAIKGSIRFSDGAPAPFASVVCSPIQRITVADENGGFSISDLPEGLYLVSYQMLGHSSQADSIRVISNQTTTVTGQLNLESTELNEVVVTGQSEPVALRNSVYQVRTISSERIRLRGATNVQTILNTELGIRLSNDMALGTTDVELLGMSGQNVKILLDGIPLPDRSSIRESIGQIDVNTIDRIEIVEGPMSVIYGTDALAGVINIITRKGRGDKSLAVSARIQEETANNEYQAITGDGVHNQSVNITWRNLPWQVSGGISRNNFGGWQGNLTGRAKAWMPKEQLLYNASAGYQNRKLNIWYRFNGTDEVLRTLGDERVINSGGTEYRNVADKKYTTWRWFHQLQGELTFTPRLSAVITGAFTDYSRKTLSTNTNLNTGQTTLSLEPGSQDKSVFNTLFGRAIINYKLRPEFQFIGGLEYNFNETSGARIQGSPAIHDYAAFLTPEIRFAENRINLRPGVRFIYNSIYNAPPAIPSINTKFMLSSRLDLRVAYAKGFRAPTLRELYFWFFDASHSIKGNQNLKAESSDSFNAFLNYQIPSTKELKANFVLGGFYNHFDDKISEALDPENPSVWSYFNLERFKTTGASLNTTLFWKSLQTTAGLQWVGTYNQYSEIASQNLPEFHWTPEVNANVIYNFVRLKGSINFSYKFTGAKPGHQLISSNPVAVRSVELSPYHMGDLSLTKTIGPFLTINGGIRNIFNTTNLTSTATDTGGAHTGGASAPMSYGRSYFLGLGFNWHKTAN